MQKFELFTKLTKFLIDGQTDSGGWGNEPGPYKEANPLNTSEVLLGLLAAGDHLINIRTPENYYKSIEQGIEYLLSTQLKTGGWSTGSAYLATPITASGNTISTCISIWALVEYSKRYHLNNRIGESFKKGLDFFKQCIRQNDCVYSPNLETASTVSSAYCALAMSLLLGVLPYNNETEGLLKNVLLDIEFDLKGECENKIIISLLSFIAIKFYKRQNQSIPKVIDSLYVNLKNYIISFNEKIVTNPVIEKQVIREVGKAKRDYTHYIPFWYSISLLLYPDVLKTKQLASAFYKLNTNIDEDDGGTVLGGKGLTWATGQTLMAYSCYFDTVDIDLILSMEGFSMVDKRNVFVVYGRNTSFKDKMFEYLRLIGLIPLEWESIVPTGAPVTFDVVANGLKRAQAVLILLTGDDEGKCLEQYISKYDDVHERNLTPQPRLNVVFESGMAMALYRDRTIFVMLNDIQQRKFTDTYGINYIGVTTDCANITKFKTDLNSRLKKCGCELLDLDTHSEWIDFEF